MELRRLTLCMAMFALAISHCSVAHSMHRRQAIDDENYEDPQLRDEATDDEAMNDTEAEDTIAPLIETKPTSYEVKIGENVVLECKLNPSDTGTVVSWYKNNELSVLGSNTMDNTRYSVENGTNLSINQTAVEDSGVWRCETMHMTHPVAINHTLLVMEKPQIVNMTASNGGKVAEGSDLILTCFITASPTPSVLWSVTKNDINERLNENDAVFKVEDNVYSMHIKNVKKDNAGQYYCYAFNKVGNHQAETRIVVIGKPRVHVPKTIVNSDLQIEAVLQCIAHEAARPHIRWYKDGVLIENSASQYVISTQGSHSNLTVTPSTDGDFGTFTCEAENSYGSHNRSIELVQSPVIEDLDIDGPRMTWTVHSHQPLELMEVQLKPTSEDGEWTTYSVPVPEGKHHKYEISYTLEDKQLHPGDYLAGVKVKNTKSWGGSDEPAILTIQDPQSLYIQTASVFRENSAHSIRPVYTALSTILMYLLVRML